MSKLPTLLVLVLVMGTAVTAEAQTAVPLPKNDVTMAVGWLGSKYPGLEHYNRWHQSVMAGVGVGHYWNDHLKTEIAGAWASRVRADGYELFAAPGVSDGSTAYFQTVYRFQGAKLSISQLYQFGENAWVHPYVGAGVDVDYLRSTEDRPEQNVSVPGLPRTTLSRPKTEERDTSVRSLPFVKGGAKMYASDRAYFITEWKVGFGDGLHHALWTTGFGVDF
jgi:outer membrane protein with beta-barrel domain